MNYYLDVLKKYAVFTGRATRQEYWMFVLLNLIFAVLAIILDNVVGIAWESGYGPLYTLYILAVIIPSIAVTVRRLHDTNRSGWWYFISLIPLIGSIILFVFLVSDTQPADNQYGPNPKRPMGTEKPVV